MRQGCKRVLGSPGVPLRLFRHRLRTIIHLYLLSVTIGCVLCLNNEEARAMEAADWRYLDKAREGEMTDKDQLTEEEGKFLLSEARRMIGDALSHYRGQAQVKENLSARFSEKRGTFVTLTMDGCLRGCIGHIIPQESVLEGIRINAINAAFRDPRFRPLSEQEFERSKIEISILTEPRALKYAGPDDLLEKLRPGRDGVIIKKGFRQATFLPQVWDQLPAKREFLRHLCLKAGLDQDAWERERLDVSTYQVQAFEE